MHSKSWTEHCDICALNFSCAQMFHRWNFVHTFLFRFKHWSWLNFPHLFFLSSWSSLPFIRLFICLRFFALYILSPCFKCSFDLSHGHNLLQTLSIGLNIKQQQHQHHGENKSKNVWNEINGKTRQKYSIFSARFSLFPFTFPCHHAPFRVLFHYCACSSPNHHLTRSLSFSVFLLSSPFWCIDEHNTHRTRDTREWFEQLRANKKERVRSRNTTTYLTAELNGERAPSKNSKISSHLFWKAQMLSFHIIFSPFNRCFSHFLNSLSLSLFLCPCLYAHSSNFLAFSISFSFLFSFSYFHFF